MAKGMEIEDVCKLTVLVGCKIEIKKLEQSAIFTQPIMIQSFLDEFGAGKQRQVTPADQTHF